MAPFGNQQQPSDSSIYDSLPPLEEANAGREHASSESLFEGWAKLKTQQLYRLVMVDPSGAVLGYPSEEDLCRLVRAPERSPRAPPSPRPPPRPVAPAADQQPQQPSFQALLQESNRNGGPICSHCGATESPQWRRGPPNKAILCNACGTRYRRTNQLGSSVPSNQRKRGAQHCASEVMKGASHTTKQPRVVA
ncbi:GATA transcription factor 27 [Chlorella vulgaris]